MVEKITKFKCKDCNTEHDTYTLAARCEHRHGCDHTEISYIIDYLDECGCPWTICKVCSDCGTVYDSVEISNIEDGVILKALFELVKGKVEGEV